MATGNITATGGGSVAPPRNVFEWLGDVFGRRRAPTNIQSYSTPYYEAPKPLTEATYNPETSQASIDELTTQIDALSKNLAEAPDFVGQEYVSSVQKNLNELTAARDAITGLQTSYATTTPMPTAETLMGHDPALLNLYNTQGATPSQESTTGVIQLGPEEFNDAVNSGRLMFQPQLDYQNGAAVQNFQQRALVFTDPQNAREEAWNLAHATEAYRQAAYGSAFANSNPMAAQPGEQAGAGPGGADQQILDALLQLIEQMSSPPQSQGQFRSEAEAKAIEAAPREAQGPVSGADLGTLLSLLGGG
jgi:hypothetical protein